MWCRLRWTNRALSLGGVHQVHLPSKLEDEKGKKHRSNGNRQTTLVERNAVAQRLPNQDRNEEYVVRGIPSVEESLEKQCSKEYEAVRYFLLLFLVVAEKELSNAVCIHQADVERKWFMDRGGEQFSSGKEIQHLQILLLGKEQSILRERLSILWNGQTKGPRVPETEGEPRD